MSPLDFNTAPQKFKSLIYMIMTFKSAACKLNSLKNVHYI